MAAIPVASGTADVQAVAERCVLMGCSFRENAGTAAAATVILRNGTAATDPIVAEIELAADGSMADNYEPGIYCAGGVYVDRVAGTSEGVLYIR